MMLLWTASVWALELDHRCLGTAEDPAPRVTVTTPSEGPDCVQLARGTTLEVPIDGRGAALLIRWTRFSGPGAHDAVATLALRYADGHEEAAAVVHGRQVWQPWVVETTPWAWSEIVGLDASGGPVSQAVAAVGLDPERRLQSVLVTAQGDGLALYGVELAQAWPTDRLAEARPIAADDWIPFVIPSEHAGPAWPSTGRAGSRGRVVACGEDLCFEDGGRARFWGINLVGDGALPEVEHAEAYAAELSRAGFNLVRLHHLDRPGQLSLLHDDRGSGPTLDPVMVDRFDRFAAALMDHGLYLVLEGPTARVLRATEAPDVGGAPPGMKHLPVFHDAWQQVYTDWFDGLYDRVNPYTGRRWLDDPGVAWVELANESSITAAWLGGQLVRLPGAHRAALDEAWNDWLLAHYAGDASLAAAWSGGHRAGLALGESMFLGSVAREPEVRGFTSAWPAVRARDLYRFYAELEEAWFAELDDHLRGAGYDGLVNGTILWGRPQSDRLQEPYDLADLHIYWDMVWRRKTQVGLDALDVPQAQQLPERIGRALAGQPTAVSELNHGGPLPVPEKALLWAVLASTQSLDALGWFAYTHTAWAPERESLQGALELREDPSFWSQAPLAARLYTSALVPEASGLAVTWRSKAATEEALGDVAERPGGTHLDPTALLRQRLRTSYASDPPVPVAGEPVDGVSWADGTLEVVTDEIVAVGGQLGTHVLGPVGLEAGGRGVVWVASDAPGTTLTESRSLWVVSSVGAANTGAQVAGVGEVAAWGGPPVLHGTVSGTLAVQMTCRPELVVLDAAGAETARTRLKKRRGAWQVPLPASPWARLDCDG